MHERPNCSVIDNHAPLSQLGLETTQGKRLIVGCARNQPIPMRQQQPGAMAVHRTWRGVAIATKPL